LNCRTRCGWSPWARQMRWTELTRAPLAFAIIAAVQWVVSAGGSLRVSATTRSATSAPSGGMRDGRVLSRRRPSQPSSAKRSCQRQTQVFDLPVRCMISTVPTPSALSSTISARQTCFWAVLRSRTSASRRRQSANEMPMEIPVRMHQTRMPFSRREFPVGLDRQISSTNSAVGTASTRPDSTEEWVWRERRGMAGSAFPSEISSRARFAGDGDLDSGGGRT
jgi:hypothetical protein